VHITSLPGPYGIGEIGDAAKKFVNDLAKMGQHYWQILPTNFPEKHNSPYDTNSAFAQNPFLISLDELIKDGLIMRSDLNPMPEFSERKVEFEKLKTWKYSILKKAVTNFLLGDEDNLIEYRKFCNEHDFWLNDYALFMVIKDIEDQIDWTYWESGYKNRKKETIEDLELRYNSEIEEIKTLQFLFDRQWRSLKAHACKKGIKLIGDIPIYISFNSSDVWMNQELFKLDEDCKMQFQSGVPPDYFMESGQLWGHPIYDWQKHQDSNFSWWIDRINHMMKYVDIIRIDHFNGLAKYWEIPIKDVDATQGQWVEAKGSELLENVFKNNGNVNLIAEDLGEAAADAAILRNKHDIPGMSILQFSFYEIENLRDMEENTVLYTGTHDNDTSIGWYESLNDKLSKNEIDTLKNVLKSDLKEVNWHMIEYSLQSRAMTVIVPIQDILGLGSDARMNTPGTINDENWSWRMNGSELKNSMMEKMKNITEKANRA
jgi:4-alpha-glucanotransferase